MKALVLCLSSIIFFAQSVVGQDTINSPYNVKYTVDIPVTVGLSAAGILTYLYVVRNKPAPDSAYVSTLSPADVNRLDRGATKYWEGPAQRNSDIWQAGSYLLPALLLLSPDISREKGKIGLLYLETMAASGFTYAVVASITRRKRPFVYNPDAPMEEKLRYTATNSFFAGHPATVASATFFTAKVFHDYYPDNRFRYLVWTAAAIPPAVVGYYRYKAGKHFFTDILAGIPIGAAIGILVPALHKKSMKSNFSFSASPAGVYCAWKL